MSKLYWRVYYWLWPPRVVTVEVFRPDGVTCVDRCIFTPGGVGWTAFIYTRGVTVEPSDPSNRLIPIRPEDGAVYMRVRVE